MVAPGKSGSEARIVMKGNSQMHPDAFLIFRIFADTIQSQAQQPAKKQAPAIPEKPVKAPAPKAQADK